MPRVVLDFSQMQKEMLVKRQGTSGVGIAQKTRERHDRGLQVSSVERVGRIFVCVIVRDLKRPFQWFDRIRNLRQADVVDLTKDRAFSGQSESKVRHPALIGHSRRGSRRQHLDGAANIGQRFVQLAPVAMDVRGVHEQGTALKGFVEFAGKVNRSIAEAQCLVVFALDPKPV